MHIQSAEFKQLYFVSTKINVYLISLNKSCFILWWKISFQQYVTLCRVQFQASTELNCCSRKDEFLSDEALIEKNAVEIVKQMQKLRGIDGEYDSETGSSSNRLAHRRTIHMLEKNRYTKVNFNEGEKIRKERERVGTPCPFPE